MLLSYETALEAILESTTAVERPSEHVSLGANLTWRVLSEPLIAESSHPRFDNSAVDGYAFHAADLGEFGQSRSVAFVAATGAHELSRLEAGQTARIFTGARIPKGASAVVMQEDVDIVDGTVALRARLAAGANVRRAGADFEIGDVLAQAGTPISAGVAALLASQGKTNPRAMAWPRCVVITSGDELVAPEREPLPGELRDSIGPMLGRAAAPYATTGTAFSPDDPGLLKKKLLAAAEASDAVFVAGGASVGDRDFTARVVGDLGRVEFHGINIRPGKPLLFGFVMGKPVLGLPGNPASAFVCFHLFGIPLLRRLGGWADPHHLWFEAPFDGAHEPEARDVFARVTLRSGTATPVLEQASFGLRALGAAQALARLPAETRIAEGDSVRITLL